MRPWCAMRRACVPEALAGRRPRRLAVLGGADSAHRLGTYTDPFALAPGGRTVAIGGEDGSVRLSRPRNRGTTQGIGPPRRGGLRRPLHARWPHARHHGRGQRRDPLGCPAGNRPRDAVRSTRPGRHAPDHTRRQDPLHGRPGRGGIHLGPRRNPAPRPAVQHRRAQHPARARSGRAGQASLALSSDGGLIARGQRRRHRQHHRRAHACPAEVVPGRHHRSRPRARLRARQPPLGRHRPEGLPRARRRRPRTRAGARDRPRGQRLAPGDQRGRATARHRQQATPTASACGPFRT